MLKTMKALVYHGLGDIRLEDRPLPQLLDERDVIVEVTLSTICTSDLHILHGTVPRARTDVVLGHEFVGKVQAVGSGIRSLHPGDRVAANCESFCGDCWFCRQGYINNCIQGGWELGCRIDGCQAAYVRVPYADMGLTRIPDAVTDRSALFVGDILSSGYFGAELCNIRPGDSVAVIGAGPVGLCAMECARLFGAARIIAVEPDPFRRRVAEQEGLCDAAFSPDDENLEACILQLTEGRGADGVIEAAGSSTSFELAWRIARPNAVVALVAMYEQDQCLPLPSMYGKNLIFKTGGVDGCDCEETLKLIAEGKINTEPLITHTYPLSKIEEAYDLFENKRDGVIKVAVEC